MLPAVAAQFATVFANIAPIAAEVAAVVAHIVPIVAAVPAMDRPGETPRREGEEKRA